MKILEKTQQAPLCSNFDGTVGLSSDIVTICFDEATSEEREVQ